jgi:succinate dehydrogenase / fumarate reductase, iron-sulfur subunit
MRITFNLYRFNPDKDAAPHAEDYRLEISRGMTVLDALIRIKNEQDGSLSMRYSCRSAICGSCAMEINGTEKLACKTSVRKELECHGRITVAPIKNLPIIKDLVADLAPFWAKVRDVGPWLRSERERARREEEEETPARHQFMLPPGSFSFHNVDACIMCGACVAACTTHEVSKGFLGPAALAKAARFVSDPRESSLAKYQRLVALQEENGIWDCTRCNMCVQVCPKDVKPMEAIIRLRRASIEAGLTETGGARHITGFRDLIRNEGRLNEALMPLKVVGLNLKRLIHLIPLGIQMWLKGKVPNPLGHRMPGIEHIRTIFAATKKTARRA